MIFSFGAMAGGFVLIFAGVGVIGCRTVSFSSSFTTCYASELGALSGSMAAFGLIATGVVLFFVAMLQLARVR